MYDGGRVGGDEFIPARWDLLPQRPLHVGVGADGPRLSEALLVLLGVAHRRPGAAAARASTRRAGNRRAAAPRVPVHRARRRQFLSGHARGPRAWRGGAHDKTRLHELEDMRQRAVRADGRSSPKLPDDMVFFTQITMEAAEDPAFLDAMKQGATSGARWSASSR